MKKFLLSVAAASLSLCANAQLYFVGNGDGLGWTPESPVEVTLTDGHYTLEVANLVEFKMSTQKGSWDDFNAGVLGCNYGDKAGVEVELEAGYTNNIVTPWAGDYTITVSKDLKTITLTTETPEPTVKELPVIYFRGEMNGWGSEDAWKWEAISETEFKFVCEDVEIAAEQKFKVADSNWAKINVGGAEGPVQLGVITKVQNGGNPADMTAAEAFNGVAWLNLDVNGDAYFVMSNDKTYVPDWTANLASVQADNNVPVVYYNLSGMQVANPANGLFIKKQGNVVTKVLVK